jgi:hypothetical protein
MATHSPWTWSDQYQQYYMYRCDANNPAAEIIWAGAQQAEAGKDTSHPSSYSSSQSTSQSSEWTLSAHYHRYFMYRYADDGTILETLWREPGEPEETRTGKESTRFSDWTLSKQYNRHYMLEYGSENIILRTVWYAPPLLPEMARTSVSKVGQSIQRDSGYGTYSQDARYQ